MGDVAPLGERRRAPTRHEAALACGNCGRHGSSLVVVGRRLLYPICTGCLLALARWGSCGFPSTWCNPTARRLGGGPRLPRRPRDQAPPSGRRVVAPWEVDGKPHPCPPHSYTHTSLSGFPETCPPGEGSSCSISRNSPSTILPIIPLKTNDRLFTIILELIRTSRNIKNR